MLSGIGFQEMLVIAVVAVLLFGRKLPEVARNAGNAYREFRKQISDLQASFTAADIETPKTPTRIRDEDDDDEFHDSASNAAFAAPPEDRGAGVRGAADRGAAENMTSNNRETEQA